MYRTAVRSSCPGASTWGEKGRCCQGSGPLPISRPPRVHKGAAASHWVLARPPAPCPPSPSQPPSDVHMAVLPYFTGGETESRRGHTTPLTEDSQDERALAHSGGRSPW